MRQTKIYRVPQYMKTLISVFHRFSASIRKVFNLGGRFCTTLEFHQGLRFS